MTGDLSGPERRFFRRFVGWLSLGQLISWGSTFYLFGLLILPIEAELHISRTQSSLAFSLMLLAEGTLSYAVGRWIDRGHARRVMCAGSVLAAACLLAHTQVISLMGFYAVWAVLGLALSCILYTPAFAVVTRRFPHDFRAAIITLTFLGGLASTVFIPLTLGLIDHFGWRTAVVVLAGFHLLVCLPIHWVCLKNEPPAPTAALKTTPNISTAPVQVHLRNPVFWLIAAFSALGLAITAAVPPHLVPLLRERALPETWVVLVPASIGVVQVLGRLLIYRLDGHFDRHRVNRAIVLLMPTSLLLLVALMFATPHWAVALGLIFAAIFGLANGMLTIVKGTAIAEYVSRPQAASLNGVLGLPSAIVRALAPLAIGALWGVSDSYIWGVFLLLTMAVACAGTFVAAQRLAGLGFCLAPVFPPTPNPHFCAKMRR